MNEQEYTQGFNKGYLLQQHKPLLFETVSKGLIDDNDFRKGFRDGGEQYEMDRTQQKIKDRMRSGRTNERGQ